ASQERPTLEASPLYQASLLQVREGSAPSPKSLAPILWETAWDPSLLEHVGTVLGTYLGPLARALVKQAAQRTSTVQMLCEMLARPLSSEREKVLFLQSMSSLMRTAAVAEVPPPRQAALRDRPDQSVPARAVPSVATSMTWDPKLLQAVQH